MFAQWKVNQAGAGVLLLRGARVIANCIHVFAFATEVPIFETFDDELIARIADIVAALLTGAIVKQNMSLQHLGVSRGQ